MNLDPSQQAAVSSRHRRTLVTGGPGTGKTEVCARWAAALMEEGVNPAHILILTADPQNGEDLGRRMTRVLSALPSPPQQKPYIGTFLDAAESLLRQTPAAFGLSDNFAIQTEAESEALWETALRETGINPSAPAWAPNRVRKLRSNTLNRCGDPEQTLTNLFQNPKARTAAANAHRRYQALKLAANRLDPDDALKLWADRLQTDPAWTDRFRARFPQCAVDDYQNLTPLHAELLRRWNPERLLALGDDNQAIDSRHGAEPGLMDRFQTEHPDLQALTLDLNHRSKRQVLVLANGILKHAQGNAARRFEAASAEPGHLGFYAWPNPAAELAAVGRWLEDMLKKGNPPGNLCLLARSPLDLDRLETKLEPLGLPRHRLDRPSSAADQTQRVVLGTFHSAKGREWENVWLFGLGESQVPHQTMTSPAALEEEQRLLYVAVTRAKNYVICSYPRRTRSGSKQEPSPLLPTARITWDDRACRQPSSSP